MIGSIRNCKIIISNKTFKTVIFKMKRKEKKRIAREIGSLNLYRDVIGSLGLFFNLIHTRKMFTCF